MQTIRFTKKADNSVIDIEDVVEDDSKIYAHKWQSQLYFLFKGGNKYYWFDLSAFCIEGQIRDEYDSIKSAFFALSQGCEKFIFDSQCEVLEYAKTM